MASGNIKGITIEIGGNTSPLEKSLKKVDGSTKKVQNELKQVDKLLKFDPKNTELLAQKQQLLAKNVQGAADKLDILKQAQKQVEQQFKRGEIGEEQYRKFQREVIAAEGQLKAFQNQLKKTKDVNIDVKLTGIEKAKKAMEGLEKSAEKIGEVGGKLSSTATPAVAGFGAAALMAAGQFDDANGKIQAALGLTAKEAERFGDIAEEVWGKGFGEDLNEVSNALIRVKQNMQGVADEDLGNVTESALALAQIFESDVVEVTRGANNLMTNFGVSAEKAFDMLAKGAQNGLNFSNELFDNVAEYAPLWSDMGYSIEEMFGILEEGAKQGVYNLDYVNDVMKEFQIRATDGSKSTSDALEILGSDTEKLWKEFAKGNGTVKDLADKTVLELSKIKDPIDRNATAVALFGTKWEDLGGDVVLAMLSGGKAMDDFEGSMEGIKKAQEDTFGYQWKEFSRESAKSLEPLGKILLDIAKDLMPPIIKLVTAIATVFASLSKPIQLVIVAFGALVAIFGPILIVVGKLIPVILKLFKTFGKMFGMIMRVVGILARFRYALMFVGGPITIIIGIIWLLIDVGIALYKNWDTVSKFMIKIWNGIKMSAKYAFEGMKIIITKTWEAIKIATTIVWNLIKSTVGRVVGGLLNNIKVAFNNIKNNVANATNKAKQSAITAFEGMRNGVANKVSALVSNVRALPGKIIAAFSNIKKKMYSIGSSVIEGILEGITSKFKALKKKAQQIADTVKQATKNALKVNSPSKIMIPLGSSTVEGVEVGIEDRLKKLKSTAVKIADTTMNAASVLNSSSARNQQQKQVAQANIAQPQNVDLTGLVNAVVQLANNQPDVKLYMDGRQVATSIDRQQYNSANILALTKGVTLG